MSILKKSIRCATRFAPFLVLSLFVGLVAGCGGGPEVDPNIKVEKDKDVSESVKASKTKPGAAKQEPGPKQRVGVGPS